ncbi:PA4575 family protein [Gilvimarinus sp. F26214L]|uniref:PA4575 family protein n=1 Tax=Gilvimarinus sp. DZF01 TaxID=3461371 RepID=UPI004045BDF2
MRLRYDLSLPADPAPLILDGPDDRHVEFHIRRDPDQTVSLVAMSGRRGADPDRITQQGPYHRPEQAVAARRAIAAELKRSGFQLANDRIPLWSLSAQRQLNATRRHKAALQLDYRFDPKDVYLDW